jgi:hypothetical protein
MGANAEGLRDSIRQLKHAVESLPRGATKAETRASIDAVPGWTADDEMVDALHEGLRVD